jgi:hypothetical protein
MHDDWARGRPGPPVGGSEGRSLASPCLGGIPATVKTLAQSPPPPRSFSPPILSSSPPPLLSYTRAAAAAAGRARPRFLPWYSWRGVLLPLLSYALLVRRLKEANKRRWLAPRAPLISSSGGSAAPLQSAAPLARWADVGMEPDEDGRGRGQEHGGGRRRHLVLSSSAGFDIVFRHSDGRRRLDATRRENMCGGG